LISVLLVALVLNLGVAFVLGVSRPMESDSFYFLCIAKSLAQGQGYWLQEGFWPAAPTMSRAPGWPGIVALGLRAFPAVSPDAVMRLMAVLLNALAAGLVAQLAWTLFRHRRTALWSGLAYAIYPVALYEAYRGTSEVLFIVLTLTGTLMVLKSKGWRPAGFLALGLAVLVRPNFLTWIGFAGVLWVGQMGYRRWSRTTAPHEASPLSSRCGADVPIRLDGREAGEDTSPTSGLRHGLLVVVLAVLFLLPSLLWAARNYRVCGHFPVLSTLRGQTFYGGNNDVVANSLDSWGYWVFPNSIPGEKTMHELSRTMSEYEVDVYYFDRGVAWVRQHAFALPRLVLGKLVRAYVPVPWNASAKSALVAACRGVLYGLGAVGVVLAWRRLSRSARVLLGAMMCANVLTVVVFWGCERFAFELEPFMIPFAVLSLATLCSPLKTPK
jgi:hypothetical protein